VRVVFYFRMQEVRWSVGDLELDALRAQYPGVEFVSVEDDADFPAAIATADVFYGFHFPPAHFSTARNLKWIHSAAAGVEANLFPALVASDVTLTNAAGVHDIGIPEHCLALMFAFARNLHIAQRLQQAHTWNRFAVIAGGAGMRELAGSRLAVLGAGAIGTGLTRLAAGLGMQVRVFRR
jgi:phosphoglycerate dehydrogenase-like enzyme